ncbi:MAG: PilZ domain-containing protein [Defluviitaleaceae bacterium]|nr:PilZ domain-containing protein [Defluviitaleaceae bacterium]
MFIEQLKSGSRVQIQKPGDGHTDGYMCKVEVLMTDKREVLIHAPVSQGKPVRLCPGEKFVLRLLMENSTFRYKAELLGYTDVDGFDVLKFRLEDGGEKIQRRSAFRFNCALEVSFSIIYSSGQQSERETGLVIDLSAGGAKIYSDKKLNVGYLLNIDLRIGDDLLVAFGDVRTLTELPRESKYKYQYGIRFTMMPESDKEVIIRYMYKMQREELKKARSR